MRKLFNRSIIGLSPAFFILFTLCGVLFFLNPQWDIEASSIFYRAGDGFYMADDLWGYIVYKGVHYATGVLIATYVIYLAVAFIKKQETLLGIHRMAVVYMAVVLILGPGLIVNTALKNGVGRARPANVSCFAGDKVFTPAFVVSNQCDNNCSFVSGHAAFGFYWVTLGFLGATAFRRRAGFIFGVSMGSVIGLVRIIQGRHFLSDIVFAFFFVYMVAAVVYWWMSREGMLKGHTKE